MSTIWVAPAESDATLELYAVPPTSTLNVVADDATEPLFFTVTLSLLGSLAKR